MLKVIVFFPSGYELDSLEVVAEIVRREAYQREAGKGYEYGLKIVRIEEGDLQKLKQLLSGQLAQEEVSRKFFSEISSEA